MRSKDHRAELTLDSNYDSVDKAEGFLDSMMTDAGIEEGEREKIEMAVRESVINAIQHGNHLDASKKVHLAVQLSPQKVTVLVRDEGEGFDLKSVPNPLEESNLLKTSGRGIFIIRSFMDEFSVKHRPHWGTEVRLVKRFA